MTDFVELSLRQEMGVRSSSEPALPVWRGRSDGGQPKTELRDAAAADNKTQPIHRWVPWIAGFSAQFAADAIEAYLPKYGRDQALVLDPFAGVATTLVEALKAGANAAGYDVNPFAILAARAKLSCVDVPLPCFQAEVEAFRLAMQRFEAEVNARYTEDGEAGLAAVLYDLRGALPPKFRSRIPFFSPPVQAKFLYALGRAAVLLEPDQSLFRAALGATMVSYSNYSYEPSLSSRPGAGRAMIENASVGTAVCRKLDEMIEDITWVEDAYGSTWRSRQRAVHCASYFDSKLEAGSVSLLVTSPPYMNNYHYVRNTRPQLHWLGLMDDSQELRALEESSLGKFWQTVRQGPAVGLTFDFPELAQAVDQLRTLHPERRHYGGAGWANYVATYFNDTDRFLRLVKHQLKAGAHAIIVIGNSIIQGMEFRVDQLLAQMAERDGLAVDDIHIVRSKRTGTSIIDSSVRIGDGRISDGRISDGDNHRQQTHLYDAAVVLRA